MVLGSQIPLRYVLGPERGWRVPPSWLVWYSDRNHTFIAFTIDSSCEKTFSDLFWDKIQSLSPSWTHPEF